MANCAMPVGAGVQVARIGCIESDSPVAGGAQARQPAASPRSAAIPCAKGRARRSRRRSNLRDGPRRRNVLRVPSLFARGPVLRAGTWCAEAA